MARLYKILFFVFLLLTFIFFILCLKYWAEGALATRTHTTGRERFKPFLGPGVYLAVLNTDFVFFLFSFFFFPLILLTYFGDKQEAELLWALIR